MGCDFMVGNHNVHIMPLRLTEENLRLHSSAHAKHDNAYQLEVAQTLDELYDSYQQFEDDMDGSDDGDLETRRDNIALRKAASIEALQAYGGCFASGFFAMQEPLPWSKPSQTNIRRPRIRRLASDMSSVGGSIQTSSSRPDSKAAGWPRPDSETLSHADFQQLKSGRKWKWRSIVRSSLSPRRRASTESR